MNESEGQMKCIHENKESGLHKRINQKLAVLPKLYY